MEPYMVRTFAFLSLFVFACAPAWADVAPMESGDSGWTERMKREEQKKKEEQMKKKGEEEATACGCGPLPGGALSLPSLLAGAALLVGARRRRTA